MSARSTEPPDPLGERLRAIEPPDHRIDFWDRLDRAATEAPATASAVPATTPRSTRRRARSTWLAVAAALVGLAGGGMAITRLASDEPTPVSTADGPSTQGPPPDRSPGDQPHRPVPPASADDEGDAGVPTTGDGSVAPTAQPPPAIDPQGDDPGDDDGGPGPERPIPDRLEAESMAIRTVGDHRDDGWSIWSAGRIEDVVRFAADGRYEIEIRARGYSTTDSAPRLEVLIDGVPVAGTTVAIDRYDRYRFIVPIEAGDRRVAIAFTNDPNRPEDDVDLVVDWIEIRPVAP